MRRGVLVGKTSATLTQRLWALMIVDKTLARFVDEHVALSKACRKVRIVGAARRSAANQRQEHPLSFSSVTDLHGCSTTLAFCQLVIRRMHPLGCVHHVKTGSMSRRTAEVGRMEMDVTPRSYLQVTRCDKGLVNRGS
jgi:hypothetical protein